MYSEEEYIFFALRLIEAKLLSEESYNRSMNNNKKQNKYIYLKVLQGQYDGCTWDDLAEADLSNVEELKKFKNDVKAYRENESYPHRVIRRRVLNPEWA